MRHLPRVLFAKTWLTGAAAIVVTVSALGHGCVPSETVPRPAPPPTASSPAPVATAAPLPSATASAAPLPPVEVGFDPKSVKPVLEDPRLATVKLAVDQEAFVRAVEYMAAALTASPGPDEKDRPAWLYQLGRLRALAGDPLGAAKAYEECAALPSLLADHARYQAADLYERAGKHEKALALARKVAPGLGIADELELVTAGALDGTGDIDGAAAAYKAHLARNPRPSDWINVTLKLANMLLHHPTEARNEEAVKLARTIIEGSSGAGVDEAKDIEKKGLSLLPTKKRKALDAKTSDTLLARARRLFGSGQYKEALKATELLVKTPYAPTTKEKQCEATLLHGDVLGKLKRKAESGDAYEEAVERCKGTPRHADALFNAGRWLATTGRQATGLARLEELEKTYPDHKLADDARMKRAFVARDAGDDLQFTKLLASLPDDYPKGDMVLDSLFELGVYHGEKHLWAASIPQLSRAFLLEKDRRERLYYNAGRFGYFLGRALLETNNEAKGKEYLAGVIRDYPLTYYMALAYARLSERDPAAAKRALDEAVAREAAEPFYVPPHPTLKGEAFLRAVELVREGDFKIARGELDVLGVGDRTAPREVLWASALLFARAGAATQAQSVLRTATTNASRPELTDWLEHYPAGKWRTAWELSFPRPFGDTVTAAAAQAQIPEALAYAIMREESSFDPRVVSNKQAVGLMQLIVPTAKTMAKPLNLPWDTDALKKPEVNIPLGCRYLGVLRKQFPDNVLLSIPSYNAGPGAPKRWLKERPGYDFDVWVERIPYDETQKYTKRVITSMTAYEALYWSDRPTEARATPLAAGTAPASAPAASVSVAAPQDSP